VVGCFCLSVLLHVSFVAGLACHVGSCCNLSRCAGECAPSLVCIVFGMCLVFFVVRTKWLS
jgi:hypothetical protein